jgi:hypothetical protein
MSGAGASDIAATALAVRSTLDDAHLDHADDWLGLMRYASGLSRRTMEEYVSRVTTGQSLAPIAAVVK